MNVIFFGIKEVEFPIFEKVKEKYKDLKLTAVTEVISKEHIHLVDGMDCVVVRENDVVNREILELLKAKGINYVFTRTAGFDHMDLAAGHELGIKMARVPSYSPTAIAELAFSYAPPIIKKITTLWLQSTQKRLYSRWLWFCKRIKIKYSAYYGYR